jgi:hypothetical protein
MRRDAVLTQGAGPDHELDAEALMKQKEVVESSTTS